MAERVTEVTCLMPVKDAMPHLRAALASIAGQRGVRPVVLAWDNGSTDGSVQELERWIPHRLAGRVIANRPLPLGESRGALVRMAETECVAWFDADDVSLPDRLALQAAYLRRHGEVAVVGSNMQFTDPSGADIAGGFEVETGDAAIRWRLRFCNPINQPTAMLRRSAVLEAGNYRPAPAEDFDLWLRVGVRHRVANLPQRLVRYRLWPSVFRRQQRVSDEQRNLASLEAHRSLVFPGVDAAAALRLRAKLLTGAQACAVRGADLRLLHAMAGRAAEAAGERADYFRTTALYRAQKRLLVRRWAKRWGAAVLGRAA